MMPALLAVGAIAKLGGQYVPHDVVYRHLPAILFGRMPKAFTLQKLTCAEREHINWKKDTPALLTHCTSAWHDEAGRHITMFYADYFFIEAINKLRGETRFSWRPTEIPTESGDSK